MLWAVFPTLLVGAVAGWLASKIMGGGGSLVRNIAVGVIGSCVGGLLFGLLGFRRTACLRTSLFRWWGRACSCSWRAG
ncbi:MAG: GlsB/YeaQ/YmgE family stress response membrane protein [Ruthenibacterium lactatiformans]